MNLFLGILVNLTRAALIFLTLFHLIRQKFKVMIPAIIALALTFLPTALTLLFGIYLDPVGRILYYVIIVMSAYLGSGLKFYDKFTWWDRVIHLLSGIFFVSLSLSIWGGRTRLSKFNLLFFSFTFAVTLHVIWEIVEYIADCLLKTDHQRWQKHSQTVNHNPKNAIQPAGLVDTMHDTIICMVSSLLTCVVWWFIL